MARGENAVAVREMLERRAAALGIDVAECWRRWTHGELEEPLVVQHGARAVAATLDQEARALGLNRAEFMAMRAAGTLPKPRAPKPATCALGLVAVEVIDEAAVRGLDPTLKSGAVLRIDAPWTERQVVIRDGRELLALRPVDAGQPAGDPSWGIFAAVREALGHREPAPEASEEYAVEAIAWAREAMLQPPEGAMAAWLRKPQARRAQIVDRLRMSFAVPVQLIEQIVGGPVEPSTLSLWPARHDAERIAVQRREAAEREAMAAAQGEAARTEANRLRTPAEVGGWLLEIRHDVLQRAPVEVESFAPTWGTPDGRRTYVLFEQIPGIGLPILDLEAFRTVPGSTAMVPPSARPARANDFHFRLTLRLREIDGLPADYGPVQSFRTELEAEDERLLDEAARIVLHGTTGVETYRKPHAMALLVRGRTLHPALVAEELYARALALFEPGAVPRFVMPAAGLGRPNIQRIEPPANRPHAQARYVEPGELPRRPLPDTVMPREVLEAACIAAAAGGVVEPGCLLSREQHVARTSESRKTKKGAAR